MGQLTDKKCIPCEGGMPALTKEQATTFLEQTPEWTMSEDARRISRKFTFKDFAKALAFVNEVGKIAEEQWHHPDISFGWGKVEVALTTHAVHGLSENDFIVAANIDLIGS